jgi:hypothetical protein
LGSAVWATSAPDAGSTASCASGLGFGAADSIADGGAAGAATVGVGAVVVGFDLSSSASQFAMCFSASRSGWFPASVFFS